MSYKLKPCPFCGGQNIYMGAFDFSPDCNIECEDCGAGFCTEVPWERNKGNREEEIKAHDKLCKDILMGLWNTRADVPDINVGNKDGWISVKDRLPEKGHTIGDTTFSKSVLGFDGWNYFRAYYNFTAKVWLNKNVEEECYNITHWCYFNEFPEPPKGE